MLVAAALLTEADEEAVATGAELVPEETAGALDAWPADEEGDGVEDGVELGEEDEVVFEPDPFEPPNGSVYCWSPADGPAASAAAGARQASASSTSIQVIVARR